ncbi:16S rRNA (uracil(1498)-N(3))-methyltransferase [Solemya velesiana gill symbiont]|uniref:Ribosomal RNA small subunit methyltransferase E n=1 Tax=Solemya velesiana gill symbiont TaxID=1918948 RepID=A0A1T2KTF8_9GAMM|nr:16S rRNA (uracil(1498)-N(3))-methyltransferase [Solemya velesiana gill symbiont]OOZ36135.1 16S rRNA (uracil(1498)-N(3))-methyltransferase [Solemya velesiana gill symbiont]
MNLVLLFDSDFVETGLVRLDGRRLAHIREVHCSQEGESVKVGLLNGQMGVGVIESLSGEQITLRVDLDIPPPSPLPLTLLMALPRPKMLKRCLSMVAELGVKELYLVNSVRVEKSFWQSPWLNDEQIRERLLLGLEQAKDTVLPNVHLRKRFKPFVEDELPGLLKGKQGVLAHPGTETLESRSITTPISEPTLLCVGPEGGFIPYEVDKLSEAGCRPVDFGRRIFRVETALPLLVGRLFH